MVAVDGVALLAEGVDRNLDAFDGLGDDRVALLAEGVDRNFLAQCLLEPVDVALLAEGVDRNQFGFLQIGVDFGSPSSRRAWIEISASSRRISGCTSPSSRRAWIEITSMLRVRLNTISRPPRGGRG